MTNSRSAYLVVLLAALGCSDDFALSVTSLDISPSPAQAGDSVVFSFVLTVQPEQRFAVILRIDGTEHARTNRFEAIDEPVSFSAGDAGDLIATYGLGTHEGAVVVRLDDGGRSATASHTFVLQEPPPPPPAAAPPSAPVAP